MTNRATSYRVNWHIDGGMPQKNDVAIIDGYSTLADIPKIIACVRTGNPNDAAYIILDQITRLDSTD